MIPARILATLLLPGLFAVSACSIEKGSLYSFEEAASPVDRDLSSIWMTDSLHGIAVGGKSWENGVILSTSDGGFSWKMDTMLNRKMECVRFDREGQGYVCGQDYALYRSPGSSHWQEFRTNYNWNKSCYFPENQHGVMAGGGAYKGGQVSTFGPEFFWQLDTLQEMPNVLADVWFSDSTTVFAVGLGWVIRSDDAGYRWQRLNLTGDFFRSVRFPTSSTGYICGSSGTLLKTVDGGSSWQTIRKGGSTGKRNQPFRALWFENADKGYLVGDQGLFWFTENGGADWVQAEEVPADVDFTGVFARNGHGWAVAKNGRIFYFER